MKTVLLITSAALAHARSLPEETKVSSLRHGTAVNNNPRQLAWDLPDWAEAWVNQTLLEQDWSSPTAWQDWWGGVMAEADMENLDVCPLLETAVGMGLLFGIAAQCECQGDLSTELEIACSFEECQPVIDIVDIVDAVTAEQRQNSDSAVCGQVTMNITFGGDMGSVAISVCTDFSTEQLQETCFSYDMSMIPGERPTQTCGASYGGQDCECSIDSYCLNLNCSSILPGAAMDTCQYVQMQNDTDLMSWIPQFDLFASDFELNADMIPWQSLDWDNLDWANFNVSAIQWSSPDWLEESWSNLVGGVSDGVSDGVCTLMTMAAQLTEQLGATGKCTCNSDDGLSIDCDFAEICVGEIAEQKRAGDPVCASVNMTLSYDTVAGIDNNVCMDFFGDSHPETCFSYTIPVADQDMEPTCTATYGGETCTCSMDEKMCLLVDCSEFEATAVMDTCQIVDMNGAVEASRFVLPFQAPEKEAITDATTVPSVEDGTDVASSEQLADSGSGILVASSAKFASAVVALFFMSYF
jgi:hypothetical protein